MTIDGLLQVIDYELEKLDGRPENFHLSNEQKQKILSGIGSYVTSRQDV